MYKNNSALTFHLDQGITSHQNLGHTEMDLIRKTKVAGDRHLDPAHQPLRPLGINIVWMDLPIPVKFRQKRQKQMVQLFQLFFFFFVNSYGHVGTVSYPNHTILG